MELTDEDDILRDGGVSYIEELRHKDLRLSDKLADEVHNWAIGTAAEGGRLARRAYLAWLLMFLH